MALDGAPGKYAVPHNTEVRTAATARQNHVLFLLCFYFTFCVAIALANISEQLFDHLNQPIPSPSPPLPRLPSPPLPLRSLQLPLAPPASRRPLSPEITGAQVSGASLGARFTVTEASCDAMIRFQPGYNLALI